MFVQGGINLGTDAISNISVLLNLQNCFDIHFISQVLNRAIPGFILGYAFHTLAEF